MATGNFVAYYRVSTERQGRSGLGLEAQQESVRSYLNGGSWRLVAEVTEVESGKKSDRPKLAEALRLCRLHNSTLIIAKLDRLARNVSFVSGLMESGVDFVAVDFPQANRLTVHILSAVAEHEARACSERTRAALAVVKARGIKLGRPYIEGTDPFAGKAGEGRVASLTGRAAKAKAKALDIAPIVLELKDQGVSLNQIAVELGCRGISTARGGNEWTATGVKRILKRASL